MQKGLRKRLCLVLWGALLVAATLAFSRAAFAQTGGPPKPGETPVFTWLENTYIGSNVKNSNWLFPVIESVHVLGIVFLVGSSALLDLRLLDRGFLREQPTSRVASRLLPVMWTAFAVMVVTGALMFMSEAWQCYTSWAFRIKMGLLLAVGLNVLIFYFAAYRKMGKWESAPVAPASARTAAWVSLILWVLIVFAGRGIAYF